MAQVAAAVGVMARATHPAPRKVQCYVRVGNGGFQSEEATMDAVRCTTRQHCDELQAMKSNMRRAEAAFPASRGAVRLQSRQHKGDKFT